MNIAENDFVGWNSQNSASEIFGELWELEPRTIKPKQNKMAYLIPVKSASSVTQTQLNTKSGGSEVHLAELAFTEAGGWTPNLNTHPYTSCPIYS